MTNILYINGGGAGDGRQVISAMNKARPDLAIFPYPETNRPWEDAQGITGYIKHQGLGYCTIVGGSLGGLTTMYWAKYLATFGEVDKIITVDSPLLSLHSWQDVIQRLSFMLSFGKSGWLWSGSPFMKMLRSETISSPFVTHQWLNIHSSGFAGPCPPVSGLDKVDYLNEYHPALFVNPNNWTHILEGV